MIFKEQLQEYLNSIKLKMDIDIRRKSQADFLSCMLIYLFFIYSL